MDWLVSSPSALYSGPQAQPYDSNFQRPILNWAVLIENRPWIDPIDSEAVKRFISKQKFAGKLNTKYELQDSVLQPGKRAFGRANSGLDFQSAQFIDKCRSSLLLLFYAVK